MKHSNIYIVETYYKATVCYRITSITRSYQEYVYQTLKKVIVNNYNHDTIYCCNLKLMYEQ